MRESPDPGESGRVSPDLARNLDGSEWGGAARLRPELSIGVDEGPHELIFGRIADFALTDEHLYVLESQPPVVRKYDHRGNWIADLGRQGAGPGEFEWPTAMVVDEASGRILVEHKDPTRLAAITLEGEPLDPFRVEHWRGANDLTVTGRGLARTVVLAEGKEPFDRQLALEWRPLAGGDAVREPLAVPAGMPPATIVRCDGGGSIATPVPFAPDFHWTPLHSGGWITGASDAYRFTIHDFTPGRDRVVERYWEPVPVSDDERAWRTRLAAGGAKCNSPHGDAEGPETPSTKRAYDDLFDDGSGRIWVVREGPGRRHDDCASVADGPDEWRRRPCWQPTRIVDVFGPSGRYLGPLDVPDELLLAPHPIAHGERVLAATLDEHGVYRLTWYRLEAPATLP